MIMDRAGLLVQTACIIAVSSPAPVCWIRVRTRTRRAACHAMCMHSLSVPIPMFCCMPLEIWRNHLGMLYRILG